MRACAGVAGVSSLVVLCGCSQQNIGIRPTPAPTPSEGQVEGRPAIGMPIRVTGTETLVVPYTIERQAGLFEDNDPYTSGGYNKVSRYAVTAESPILSGGGGVDRVRWHNAVIKSPGRPDSIVLPGRGVISGFAEFRRWNEPEQRWAPARSYAFLTTTIDGNADGYLNNLDPNELRVATVEGGELRVVTPAGSQVWDLRYDSSQEVLFIQVVRDTNADGRFDYADEPMFYWVSPESSTSASPVIDETILKELGRRLGH